MSTATSIRVSPDTLLDTGGTAVYSLLEDAGTLYAGASNGRVYSYNGSAWTDIYPFGFSPVRALASNGVAVYAGCDDGYVYRYMVGPTGSRAARRESRPSGRSLDGDQPLHGKRLGLLQGDPDGSAISHLHRRGLGHDRWGDPQRNMTATGGETATSAGSSTGKPARVPGRSGPRPVT